MQCASWNASNQVVIVTPPPADLSSCALLIPNAGDSLNSPFTLSVADGVTIGSAIVFVWGVGYASRSVIRALRG